MKKLLIIVIVFQVLITLFIVVTKPQMHKRVVFGSSNIEVLKTETAVSPAQTELKPIQAESTTPKVEVKQADNIDQQNKLRMKAIENTAKKEVELKLAKQKTEQVAAVVNTQTAAKTQSTSKPVVKTVQQAATKPVQQNVTSTPAKAEVNSIKATPAPAVVKKEVDWEPWRIKIGTAIFANTSAQLTTVVPIGTQYEYSFNVDNNKKISGIQVRILSSNDRTEAEKGVKIIIPAIMNLNGKSTLVYPDGAEGVTTAPMKAIITVKEG